MKTTRVTIDFALDDERIPVAGDVLHTARCMYWITEVRPVDSKVWGNRWMLHVERIVIEVVDPGVHHFHSRRYQRGETPAHAFGEAA